MNAPRSPSARAREASRVSRKTTISRSVVRARTQVVDDFSEDDDECLSEFKRRVGDYPERLRNLHFTFALVLTALREAKGALKEYVFDPEDADMDAKLRDRVASLVDQDLLDEPALNKMAPLLRESAVTASECVLSSDMSGEEYVEEAGIWQMRQRSRAMLRVMDCVQCGACRLHGKVAWCAAAREKPDFGFNPFLL